MRGDKTFIKIYEGGRDAELLEAVADIVEKPVFVHRAGNDSAADSVKIGDKIKILSPRLSNDTEDQTQGPWEMAYAIGDDGGVAWVWIGHKLLGPCYQCGADGKWRNCFSHGNFGKNHAAGGNWSGSGGKGHKTFEDCAKNRINDAKNLTAGFDKMACIPGMPPKLAVKRFAKYYDYKKVQVENETIKIVLPGDEYSRLGRAEVFNRAMAAMGNASEVDQMVKEGWPEDDTEMRYRKSRAGMIKGWEIKIIGEMPEQIGLCRYKHQQSRDTKGRFCK